MSEKRFIIDVEDEFQENAVFFGDEFLCFEDDSESLVSKLNEQQSTINELKEAIDYLKTVIRYTIPNEMVADVFKQIGEEYE